MKVRSFLNGLPFEELSKEELIEFARESQIKMLKIAGYAPIDQKKNKKKTA